MGEFGNNVENYSEKRFLDRNQRLFIISAFMGAIGEGMYILFTLFLVVAGATYIDIGAYQLVQGVVSLLSTYSIGSLADKYGPKNIQYLGFLLGTASTIPLLLIRPLTFYILIALALISGIASACYSVGYPVMVDKITPKKSLEKIFSYSMVVNLAGSSLGSLINGFFDFFMAVGFSEYDSYRILFVIAQIFFNLHIILIALIKLPRVPYTAGEDKKKHRLTKEDLRFMKKFLTSYGILAAGAGIFISFLPLYLSVKFGFTPTEISYIGIGSNIAVGVCSLLAPKLSKKIGAIKTISFTQFVATGIIYLFIVSPREFVPIIYALRAGLMNMASPVYQAFILRKCSEESKGKVVGLTQSVFLLLFSLFSLVGGILFNIHPDLLPLTTSVFYFVSTALFMLFFIKEEEE